MLAVCNTLSTSHKLYVVHLTPFRDQPVEITSKEPDATNEEKDLFEACEGRTLRAHKPSGKLARLAEQDNEFSKKRPKESDESDEKKARKEKKHKKKEKKAKREKETKED